MDKSRTSWIDAEKTWRGNQEQSQTFGMLLLIMWKYLKFCLCILFQNIIILFLYYLEKKLIPINHVDYKWNVKSIFLSFLRFGHVYTYIYGLQRRPHSQTLYVFVQGHLLPNYSPSFFDIVIPRLFWLTALSSA